MGRVALTGAAYCVPQALDKCSFFRRAYAGLCFRGSCLPLSVCMLTLRSSWAQAATATPSSIFNARPADESTEAVVLHKANLSFLETKEGGLSLKPPISTHF